MESILAERMAIDTALENVYNGADVSQSLKKAADDTNSAIAKVNKENKTK